MTVADVFALPAISLILAFVYLWVGALVARVIVYNVNWTLVHKDCQLIVLFFLYLGVMLGWLPILIVALIVGRCKSAE